MKEKMKIVFRLPSNNGVDNKIVAKKIWGNFSLNVSENNEYETLINSVERVLKTQLGENFKKKMVDIDEFCQREHLTLTQTTGIRGVLRYKTVDEKVSITDSEYRKITIMPFPYLISKLSEENSIYLFPKKGISEGETSWLKIKKLINKLNDDDYESKVFFAIPRKESIELKKFLRMKFIDIEIKIKNGEANYKCYFSLNIYAKKEKDIRDMFWENSRSASTEKIPFAEIMEKYIQR
ncbi:MAG: hypothetical protein COZ91_01675 [Candidatus Nealsonbacteria bacterium CG_4_8_14_3_um_filter_39_7]|nr:MAG: hypothetical protein COZ91_01675 [Candidatus Nealsonbacteria bacterium CG_4_8_14_3_um_filter_39_7]